jgi:hypothetical protein
LIDLFGLWRRSERTAMNQNQGGAFYAPDTRNWWQRLLSRMFPARSVPIPEDLDGWAPSYMQTHVVATLDWRDRLRVLVSGKVHIQTNTKTDVPVGRMHSDSAVWAEAP